MTLDLFRLLLMLHPGCWDQHQRDVADCLHEENRVLRELLGNERLRLNDERPPGVCDRVDIQLLVGYDARYGLSRTRIGAHEPSASY